MVRAMASSCGCIGGQMCSTCPAPVIARRNDSRSSRSPTAISDAPACLERRGGVRPPHERAHLAAFPGDGGDDALAGLAGRTGHQDRLTEFHFLLRPRVTRYAHRSLLRCDGATCCNRKSVARYPRLPLTQRCAGSSPNWSPRHGPAQPPRRRHPRRISPYWRRRNRSPGRRGRSGSSSPMRPAAIPT